MKKVKLGEVLEVKRGMSLSGDYYSEEGELIRLTLGNFNYPGGGFKDNTSKNNIYFTGQVRPEFILNKGDIITPLTEQVSGLLGETALIPESGKYIQSGDVGLVTPKEGLLDRLYCYYLLASPLIKRQLGAGAQQTKIRHTSPDKIMDCEAYIPDYLQQKKIGKLLASIDEKIKVNNEINDNLSNQIQDIFNYWFLQYEFSDDNGKPYKSNNNEMFFSEQINRHIPYGWKVDKLSSVCKLINGRAYSQEELQNNGKYKIARVGNFFSNNSWYYSDMELSPDKYCDTGDLLYCWSATFGPFIWDMDKTIYHYHIWKVDPYSEIFKPYIYETLKVLTNQMMNDRHGSVMAHLTKDNMENYNIVIPPTELVEAFYNKANHIYNEIISLKQQNRHLIALREWILPMLMNGQATIAD